MPADEEQSQLLMNDIQFQLAIKGSRLSDKNIKIAYSILVEDVPRADVLTSEGLTKQSLSKIIQSVETNLKKQLDKHDLVAVEHIIPRDKLTFEDRQEVELITRILYK